MGQQIYVKHLNIYYGSFLAVEDVNLHIAANKVTAFIGPSGCGKSTVLAVEDVNLHIAANKVTAFIGPSGCGKSTVMRTLDRMHEITPGAHCTGEVLLEGQNLYAPDVDPVAVRRDIGMVFQRPNPFPTGCGKSTVLRTLDRMHEITPGAHCTGEVLLEGQNLYAPDVDPVAVRRDIGMVFQRPNPVPTMSIRENVLAGVTLNNRKISKSDADDLVEWALRGANLWNEVKDRLNHPGVGLSGGQQQRLCIARAVAVHPTVLLNLWNEVKDRLNHPGVGLSGGQQQRLCIARAVAVHPTVLLMDEPCSALDPISTLAVEDLIEELKQDYTIVIVTHNMQQAARIADYDHPGVGLSGGQQQRLCIARAVAVHPTVLLMDEPCSALDPISTLAVEDLIEELKQDYTIVIVTHNMQQAARIADYTAFFNLKAVGQPGHLEYVEDLIEELKQDYTIVIVTHNMQQAARIADYTAFFNLKAVGQPGHLEYFADTTTMFNNPQNEEAERYVSGHFG